jgi:hypothetical protein
MRPISNRRLLRKALLFWVAFTAIHGALRLIKHDEWRWDHYAEICLGMLLFWFIAWVIVGDKQTDASPPPKG